MTEKVNELYGNRVRVRVCGLCWKEGELLLVNHAKLSSGAFWAPPGGGLEFGETVEACLTREFREETGLIVKSSRFLCICEFNEPPLHAVELFFEVVTEGDLTLGIDPEMSLESQIIQDVRFFSWNDIQKMNKSERHGIFSVFSGEDDLKKAAGYWKI